jgi:peptide deformylase
MTVRPLRLLGDPVLRTPCDPVTRFDAALAQLVQDLLDTVQLPGRAGLAAPQIGSSLSVFSYNTDGELGYLINPVIAEVHGDQDGPEGCLSIPGITANRPRAARVTAAGLDLEQRPVRVTGTGELARCLQHETDHLRGELYVDGLPGAERRDVMQQIRRQQVGAGAQPVFLPRAMASGMAAASSTTAPRISSMNEDLA